MGDGFGDINNYKVEALSVFDGYLYAVADNNLAGLQVWRSADGTTWGKIAQTVLASPQTLEHFGQTPPLFSTTTFS